MHEVNKPLSPEEIASQIRAGFAARNATEATSPEALATSAASTESDVPTPSDGAHEAITLPPQQPDLPPSGAPKFVTTHSLADVAQEHLKAAQANPPESPADMLKPVEPFEKKENPSVSAPAAATQPRPTTPQAAPEQQQTSHRRRVSKKALAIGATVAVGLGGVGYLVTHSGNKARPSSTVQTYSPHTPTPESPSSTVSNKSTKSDETNNPTKPTYEQMKAMSIEEFTALPQSDRIAYAVQAENLSLNSAVPDDREGNILATEQQGLIQCYGETDTNQAIKCLSAIFYYTGAPDTDTTGYNYARNQIEKNPGSLYTSGYEDISSTPATQGKDDHGNPVTYRDVVYKYSSPGNPDVTHISRYFLTKFTQPDGTTGARWLVAYTATGNVAPDSWNQ